MTPPVTVFDCMVYLQAAGRPEGPARACLDLAREGRILLTISPAVRAEVEDVLNRPRLRAKFTALTPEAVVVFLHDIDCLARNVEQIARALALPRDPKDEPYLNLALSVGASYLITWDKDLLDLMNQDLPEGREYRQRFPQLTILTPVAFLEALRNIPEDDGQTPRPGEQPPG
jgi:putative PIN family toxin of toxin-antitoxin system